jgi:DNA-binding FadR family transcriptional regulator
MDQLQVQILGLLAEAGTPDGAGALLHGMRGLGVAASQATLGRALKKLDERGLTARVSNKGRVITSNGRQWLTEARRKAGARRWTEQTLMAVGQSTLGELRQSMIARRAIEGEIARMATESATPAKVAELRLIVEDQAQDLRTGGQGAEQAVDFHVALARACGNRFLAAAADLVRTSSGALETLMYHLGADIGTSYHNHVEVVEAIERRDPDEAEHAMVLHLNELITHIDSWLARLEEAASLQHGAQSGNGHSADYRPRRGGDRTGRSPARDLGGDGAQPENSAPRRISEEEVGNEKT